ncbi:MAG: GTP cyclohydrolase I FolE2 [Candidatus Eisenbacteria bacterium]|nr:GTP cyclohydrolase I FolE2 [Candidatus Eisenbacteria bacterium]
MSGIQDAPDRTEIPLDGIGVTELVYPVTVPARDGAPQTTAAAFSLNIAMGKEARGAHMSRFVEILDGDPRLLSAAGLRTLLTDLVAAHEARAARAEIDFTFFVHRSAPVSGAGSLLACPVTMEASLGDDFDLVTTVVVPVMTVCPCSKEATGGPAHSQRGHVAVSIRTEGRVWIEEIVELVEDCASAPVYPLLKGDDERSVIEDAHEDPVLVEDLVRRTAERLDSDVRVSWYRVEAENLDSVHDHNLSACVERPLS